MQFESSHWLSHDELLSIIWCSTDMVIVHIIFWVFFIYVCLCLCVSINSINENFKKISMKIYFPIQIVPEDIV